MRPVVSQIAILTRQFSPTVCSSYPERNFLFRQMCVPLIRCLFRNHARRRAARYETYFPKQAKPNTLSRLKFIQIYLKRRLSESARLAPKT